MQPPTYLCHRVERELILSGKVDDPLWHLASPVELTDPVTGQPKRYRTTVRALYSDRTLFLGFQCEDEYVWGTLTERDSQIFREECVEAFICPSGQLRQYYEINVSPRNTVFDAVILNRSLPDGPIDITGLTEYTCPGLETRVHINGELGVPGAEGWSAEYAIPFAGIVGHQRIVPEPGDEWRINFYRIDSTQRDALDLYAWSSPGKNAFHIPWRFGVLRFS